ncbi:MAG: hypothetical protein AAF495_28950 [Pseudomonadota bacterium]
MIRSRLPLLFGALFMAFGLILAPGRETAAMQDEMVILTGEHWQQLDHSDKVSYVLGVMQVVEMERHLDVGEPVDETSLIPYLVKAMQGRTINDVVVKTNEYYRLHPDELGRPVIDAIFQAIVIPTL